MKDDTGASAPGRSSAGIETLNSPLPRTTLSLSEAMVVATICFGLFILWSIQAVLAGFPQATFTDAGNVLAIVIELVLGTLALLYLGARNFDVRSLYPRPDLRGSLVGLALYFAVLVVNQVAMLPFTMQGGPLPVTKFSFGDATIVSTVLFSMVNGAFEEIFLLGVLTRSLKGHGASTAIGLPLLVRMLYHLYQGPVGAVSILAFGFVFAAFYVRTGRLWPVVFAHMLADVVAMVLGDA